MNSTVRLELDDDALDAFRNTPMPKLVRNLGQPRDPRFEGTSLTFKSGVRSVPALESTAGEGLTALEFLTGLAQELSRGPLELPCFPNVVVKIRDALHNPKTSFAEIVKLAGTEPRFAARLLQMANSAAVNTTGKRVLDLRSAITRLGQQMVQGAAMAYAVQQMKHETSLRVIAVPLGELWRRSIAVATICQVIARRTRIKPDQAFLAGLFHGIGHLYIMAHAVDKSWAVNDELLSSELIAGWHPSIGKAVLENWDAEECMAEAVGAQFEYGRRVRAQEDADLTDILIASVALADEFGKEPGSVQIDGVNSFKTLGLNIEDCLAILKNAEYKMAALQDSLGV